MWGIDRLNTGHLSGLRKRLRNASCAVLTHGAAVDRKGRQSLEVLADLGVEPRIVFTPEHGLHGVAQAEEAVPHEEGQAGQSAVVSLYGTSKESLAPRLEQFEGVSTLVIDLVDVGARYYTYVWTALLAVRAARAAGVHTVILDRPNPLSGSPDLVEGAPQQDGFMSFVGLAPIPVRHSMTLAEVLLHTLSHEDGVTPGDLGPDGSVSVVSCWGWERLRDASAWGRPFVPPSPNMPSAETALIYPGGCLVEGTNLSEGRGTTLPFRVYGAPFVDEQQLTLALRNAHLPGVLFRPVRFKPCFDKHAGTVCKGVMVHVTDARSFRPLQTLLTLLCAVKHLAPSDFEFLTRAYEFEHERVAFDLLTGSSAAREAILGGADANALIELVCPVPSTWSERLREAEALVQAAQA